MTLQVVDAAVSAGEPIVGHVKPSGDPATIVLIRTERAGEVNERTEVTRVTSEGGTGAFELTIPRWSTPTVRGKHVSVNWRLESGGKSSATLQVRRDPQDKCTTFYSTGEAPQIKSTLSRRNHEYIYNGGILFLLFIFGFFYIERVSRDASALGRFVGLGIIAACALASLAICLMAAGTRWPRTIDGFEPTFTPDVAERGGIVELRTSQTLPTGLRLLCIESYGARVEYHREDGLTGTRPVMQQHTHPPIWPTPTASGCTFQLPSNALPSVRCEAGDVMWVVRQGGRTIGPWGPFRFRDWGVVVR